jgi:hypothetical protein
MHGCLKCEFIFARALKGEFKKIDYMLAIDSEIVSLPYEEAKDRLEERSEMYKIFGAG